MSDVINLCDVSNTIDLPVERVLEAALKNSLTSVIIVGYDENGDEYFASSIANGPKTLWMLERCKLRLLNIVDEFIED